MCMLAHQNIFVLLIIKFNQNFFMKILKFLPVIVAIFLPYLANAQCVTLSLYSSNYNGFNVSCNGANDGELIVNAVANSRAINYIWSNGSTETRISGLTAGSYSVTVTDHTGCSATANYQVTEPTPLSVAVQANANDFGYNIYCYGQDNATATATASNGVSPYIFHWSNGASTNAVNNLTAGFHSVVVVDQNGCSATKDIEIVSPSLLTFSSRVLTGLNGNHLSYQGASDGSAAVSANGGSGNYTYEWSNGFRGANASNLSSGTYKITVTDAFGCTAVGTVTILEPNTIGNPTGNNTSIGNNTRRNQLGAQRPLMPQGISPNNDGLNDNFVIKNIENYPDNELIILDAKGREVAKFNNYNNDWNGLDKSNRELPSGNYKAIFKFNENNKSAVINADVQIKR